MTEGEGAEIVLLENPFSDVAELSPESAENPRTSIEVIEDNANTITLKVKTDTAGLVVVRDTYFPGWDVQVDGRFRRILQADFFFRAVPVLPGEHLVEWRYSPSGLTGLIILCLFSWAAVICLILILWHRRRIKECFE